jgi:hypothetical protein
MNYRRVPFAAHIKGDTVSGFMAGVGNMAKVRLEAKKGASPGWPGFVGWLATVHPKLYDTVRVTQPGIVASIESNRSNGSVLSGDEAGVPGAATSASALQTLAQTVVQAGATILPLIQQQKVLKLQLERAKQGLPPLDVGAYIDPNQGVNVGLTPATQKTLLWLGGGVVGAYLLTRLLGRR